MSLAETGHLVMTTVHSRSAEQAINRIVSMFPTDEQPQIQNHLAENMIAIIIQKLVKKAKEHGVVAVHEILLNNTPVANTIRDNKLNQIDNVIFTNSAIRFTTNPILTVSTERSAHRRMLVIANST